MTARGTVLIRCSVYVVADVLDGDEIDGVYLELDIDGVPDVVRVGTDGFRGKLLARYGSRLIDDSRVVDAQDSDDGRKA